MMTTKMIWGHDDVDLDTNDMRRACLMYERDNQDATMVNEMEQFDLDVGRSSVNSMHPIM